MLVFGGVLSFSGFGDFSGTVPLNFEASIFLDFLSKIDTWKAKCPIFKAIVAGFRGEVAMEISGHGFQGPNDRLGGYDLVSAWRIIPVSK